MNSPKDYLTDREKWIELRDILMEYGRKDIGLSDAIDKLLIFLTLSMEVGKGKTTKKDVLDWLFDHNREMYYQLLNKNER